VLRYPLVRTELDNILNDFVPLTYDYSTAISAHIVLEQVIEIQCMLAMSTDYRLKLTSFYHSLIRVANTPNTQFLLQSELNALINQGLQYKEITNKDGSIYKGYVNKDGAYEGPAIIMWTDGIKEYGEWHLNKRLGCRKFEC
jgi:hypothetical protein